MLNQKKEEIFLAKFHKSLAKQFLEVALMRKIIFYIVFMTPFIRHETLFYLENIYFLFESCYDFLSNL